MRFIRFFPFVLFNYYKRGRWVRIPHFQMVCGFSFLVWLNLTSILTFAGQKIFANEERYFISLLATMIPVGILISLLAPEKVLREISYAPEIVRIGGWILFSYIVASLTFLIFAIAHK